MPANDNDVIDNDSISGVCGKSIGNGVNIFVHFFSTPISILNLTMSSESQENDVSNDILSKRKYFQLFTHESNTFLLEQYRANRFNDAAQQWRLSLFVDCSQTDENAMKTWSPPVSLHSLGVCCCWWTDGGDIGADDTWFNERHCPGARDWS